MILTGSRKPPLALAIHIFRETGWRHATIAELDDQQIDALERVERWQARGKAVLDHVAADTPSPAAGSTGQSGQMSGGTDMRGVA